MRRSLFALLVVLSLMAVLPPLASAAPLAHRDGCHRWHSCPSDHGTYVCGDLGYYSECPGGAPAPVSPHRTSGGSGSTGTGSTAGGSATVTQAVVATSSLKLRSGAGTGYSALATYARGTVLTYLGRSSGGTWVHVRRAGLTGWVLRQYVTLR